MLSKNSKNILKSITVLTIGSILGLLILELSLRCFGYYLNHWNKFTFIKTKQSDELRVLTLGESMTNSSVSPYPAQLHEILSSNLKINKKINVINGAVPGSSSKEIVRNIDSYLDRFNPDIVVIMTGINNDRKVDYDQWANIQNGDKLDKIKSYKLIRYLYQLLEIKFQHILEFMKAKSVFASDSNIDDILIFITNNNISNSVDTNTNQILNDEKSTSTSYEDDLLKTIESSTTKDIEYVKLANYYTGNGQNKKAIETILKAIIFNPNNSDALLRLSENQDLPQEYQVRLAQKAIETNPQNSYAYTTLGEIYRRYGESEKRIDVFKQGLKVNPNSFILLYEIGRFYYSQEQYQEAEKYLSNSLKASKETIGENSNEKDIYQLLAKIYQKQNRIKEANEVLKMAVESSDILENNYQIIANILKKRGVKLIAMQYPLRDVNILKNILKDYDVAYVDNKESFEIAINKNGKESVFVDTFAGDFGHCTPEGNRIIANNVASVILNNYVFETN